MIVSVCDSVLVVLAEGEISPVSEAVLVSESVNDGEIESLDDLVPESVGLPSVRETVGEGVCDKDGVRVHDALPDRLAEMIAEAVGISSIDSVCETRTVEDAVTLFELDTVRACVAEPVWEAGPEGEELRSDESEKDGDNRDLL